MMYDDDDYEPPQAAWGVWCRVSGGVTGTNEAWLKTRNADGVRVEWEGSEEQARAKAAELMRTVASDRYRTADFRYTAQERW